MLTTADAKACIAEAQAWFSGLAITPQKQALWATSLSDVGDLEVEDVRRALKLIAEYEKPEYWRLEIAEILRVSKLQMRQRRANEAQDLRRPALESGARRGSRTVPKEDAWRYAAAARATMAAIRLGAVDSTHQAPVVRFFAQCIESSEEDLIAWRDELEAELGRRGKKSGFASAIAAAVRRAERRVEREPGED
jgi:hypothetical protein